MFSLGEMARILGDSPRNCLPAGLADKNPAAVVTDSRQAGAGSLFVCIKGERSDGHDFITQVAEQGALAALVSHDVFAGATPPLALIYAQDGDDTVPALGRLGASARAAFKGFVVGVTGSAGKTSVKEVLAAVLSVRGKAAKNFMNLNSQIGLPVSLLNADEAAEFWVMEAGISAPHDMDELGEILRPDLAVIINVGAAHLEGLAGLEGKGVAHYKSRLLKYVSSGGRALVSADYPDLVAESREAAGQSGAELKYFSTRKADADYYAAYLGPASAASGRYRVHVKGSEAFEVTAPFRGTYGSENVAAISGAAHLAGLSAGEIILGFAGATLPAQRFSCASRGDFTVIDDTYNANPLSTMRMLETAAEMAAEGVAPLFLAMGEMLELGSELERAHRELGAKMAVSGAKVIVWKAKHPEATAAVRAGLLDGNYAGEFCEAESLDEFERIIPVFSDHSNVAGAVRPRGVILFKASRSMRLELWAEAFKNNYFLKLEE